METHKTFLGFVVLVLLGMGCGSLPFLFSGIPFLGLLGLSFLILDVIIIIAIRKKGLALKRTNPELFEALRAEAKRKAQEARAREIRLTDFPRWFIPLLFIAVAFAFIELSGLFAANALLENLLLVFIILFLACSFFYEYKIRKKKKRQALELKS
jgi:uncharacterized membrane protein